MLNRSTFWRKLAEVAAEDTSARKPFDIAEIAAKVKGRVARGDLSLDHAARVAFSNAVRAIGSQEQSFTPVHQLIALEEAYEQYKLAWEFSSPKVAV